MIRRLRAARQRRRQAKRLAEGVPAQAATATAVMAPAEEGLFPAMLPTAVVLDADPLADTELRLVEIPLREMVELVRIDLPTDELEPLLELGLLPGCQLCPVRRSPFGDPVLMVDGSLIALRREMAGCICVRRAVESGAH